MVQKANSPCISLPILPFKYKYQITARYSTLDEKHAFASPAIFEIQYLIKGDSIGLQFCTHV